MAKGERRTRAPRRATRRQRTIIAVTVTVLAAVVVGYFAYRAQANLPGVQFVDQGNLHVASPDTPHEKYNSDPPTSGPHLPYIAPWGVHTRPIVRELQVHNLEAGGVVVHAVRLLPCRPFWRKRMGVEPIDRLSRTVHRI